MIAEVQGGGQNRHKTFMNDNEFRLQREVRELKAEVRRLRRFIIGGFAVAGLFVVIIFPELLMFALEVAVCCFFAFLVSPVRRMIFSYLFGKRDGRQCEV